MTEQELRALVREAISRHLEGAAVSGSTPDIPTHAIAGPAARESRSLVPHASHALFMLPAGGDAGACLIEPTVRCNHCGYCQSYGH